MKKNQFIAFEGIDGSGKSTQVKLLSYNLKNAGHKVYLTCEPTDRPIGKMIRDIFSHKMEADHRTIAALFVADRLDHLLNKAGFYNVFSYLSDYPKITLEQLAAAKPQVILLTSEPFPFTEKHIAELQAVLPKSFILKVDGQLFSWFGSRIQYAPKYFQEVRSIMLNNLG